MKHEQVFAALEHDMASEPAETATEKLSVVVDAGLRRVIVPHEDGERWYPLLTAYELDCIHELGSTPGLRSGKLIAYIIWLSQRRTPGHVRRVDQATQGDVSRGAFARMMGARIIDRVLNALTGRRSYDQTDYELAVVSVVAAQEWIKKKRQKAARRARLAP